MKHINIHDMEKVDPEEHTTSADMQSQDSWSIQKNLNFAPQRIISSTSRQSEDF